MTNMHPDQMEHTQLPTAHVFEAGEPEPVSTAEMGAINANLGKMAVGEPIKGQQRLIEGWQLATHDKLVPQLLNRDGIQQWFERYRPTHAAVMLLDVVRFKYYNDTYGQKVGDQILEHVGNMFLKNLRTEDKFLAPDQDRRNNKAGDQVARNSDVAGARYGGDEFIAVVNLDAVPLDKQEPVMQSIQARFDDFDPYAHEGENLPISIRSVYHISTDPAETIDQIYEQLSPELATKKHSST